VKLELSSEKIELLISLSLPLVQVKLELSSKKIELLVSLSLPLVQVKLELSSEKIELLIRLSLPLSHWVNLELASEVNVEVELLVSLPLVEVDLLRSQLTNHEVWFITKCWRNLALDQKESFMRPERNLVNIAL
jgi:hypothetical protein